MQNLPPLYPSATRIQIADDAVTRVTLNCNGTFGHQQRLEKSGLSRSDTGEKEIGEEEEEDERDVRKKQVQCSTSFWKWALIWNPRLFVADIYSGTVFNPLWLSLFPHALTPIQLCNLPQ